MDQPDKPYLEHTSKIPVLNTGRKVWTEMLENSDLNLQNTKKIPAGNLHSFGKMSTPENKPSNFTPLFFKYSIFSLKEILPDLLKIANISKSKPYNHK